MYFPLEKIAIVSPYFLHCYLDGHLRRESVGSLDQHLQVDSRKRAKSFPYEEIEHSITPLTLSPNRSPTLTPMLSPVMEEGEVCIMYACYSFMWSFSHCRKVNWQVSKNVCAAFLVVVSL